MKKCYIAGKVTGLPEAEYRAKFRKAEIAVSILGFEPLNPITLPHEHDKSWESYMRDAIREMLDCEALYALADWKDSRGARIEVQLAQDLGMQIIYERLLSTAPVKIIRERDTFWMGE
jgi:hypothetical protein